MFCLCYVPKRFTHHGVALLMQRAWEHRAIYMNKGHFSFWLCLSSSPVLLPSNLSPSLSPSFPPLSFPPQTFLINAEVLPHSSFLLLLIHPPGDKWSSDQQLAMVWAKRWKWVVASRFPKELWGCVEQGLLPEWAEGNELCPACLHSGWCLGKADLEQS